MTFGDEIINRLVAQGVGVYNTTLFLSSKSVVPPTGSCLTVTVTSGAGPLFVQNAGTPATQRPSAQLLARAEKASDAMAFARLAYVALTLHNVSLSGTFYLELVPTQEPYDLGVDGNGRAQAAFNVMARKRPS